MDPDLIDKIYDDYLYDCHIANQRLTDEEWAEYGQEVHHIEIPDRDGGLLTPTNRQPLTTYQHWVAGVMQSEVKQKKCFFVVPTGVLPPLLETLRSKWVSHHNSEVGKKGGGESGRKNAESGHIQRQASKGGQKGSRVTNSIRVMCTVTGTVMNPGNLTQFQRRNNIDPVNRIRLHPGEQPMIQS